MGDPGGRSDVACENCGVTLGATTKFCPECGTPIVAAPPRETRKTVTLLFCDVTGSTAMGEQLDPEAYRGVMGRYFTVASEAVERHGGTVEKFVGDAVLAVFGVPEVREDDALRAVRAAHELNVGVAALSAELARSLGVELVIRTGVNTGSVVTGSARAGGSFATGDAVNAAARLEQAAPPGSILLGAETFALVRDAVDVEPVDPITAKGKAEPLAAYRLVAVDAAATGRARRADAELVGRDREARVLEDALERTLASGRSHLVTVLGAAGIGKSRLVADFVSRVGDRADVVGGRCVSYGQGITYWPVVQLLHQALGLSGGESDEVARHALTSLTNGSADGERVSELLMPLLGQAGTPGDAEQTFWAVRRALEQLAARKPLVVTVDDLHWAEPTLLDLLERVRDEVQDLPLLLVCQARPELLDTHPSWGGGSMNSMTFGLEPFTADETDASMSALLGGGVPPGVVAEVVGRAGGNPLFVEEITAHLVEIGLLIRDGTSWRVTGDLTQARIPPTVSALLAARLDRLPPAERRLLERVSVIGLELTTDEAVALAADAQSAGDVPAVLAALTRRDLLRRVRGPGGESWAFKHVMIRDAAYDSLPKAVRAGLHERFADRVEAAGTDPGAEREAFVGHHLEQAARLRRDLGMVGPELEELTVRAAKTLAAAARAARDRDDLAASLALIRRAVALKGLPVTLMRDLQVGLSLALHDLSRPRECAEVVEEYAASLDASSTDLDRAYVESQRLNCRLLLSEDVAPAEVAASASRAATLARAAGDRQRLAVALHIRLMAQSMLARWEEARGVVDELVVTGGPYERRMAHIITGAINLWGPAPMSVLRSHAEAMGTDESSPGHDAQREMFLAITSAAMDAPDSAERTERAYQTHLGLNEGAASPYFIGLLAVAPMLSGSCRRAIDLLDHAIADCQEKGDLAHASTLLGDRATMMLELGLDTAEIRPVLEEAVACTSSYDVISLAQNAAVGSAIALREGDLDTAVRLGREAVEIVDRSDQASFRAAARVVAAESAGASGDHVEQRRLLEEALAIYRSKEIVHRARLAEARLAQLP
ncbi:MAG: adenylate/guanylate cyclase [Nocardioides sp.]|nr:adenylate/guanylate cyclase [Nocardioides sp.]